MNRRIALIAGGVLAVVVVAWFALLWRPQTAEIDEARAREEAALAQNAQIELELARLQASSEKRTELVATQELLRSAVPDEAQLEQFILDSDDAATAAEVDFVAIAPAPPAPDADPAKPTSVTMTIEVKGGYFQVLDYLNRILGLDRVVVFDTISMKPGDDRAETLEVGITARMFTPAAPAGADADDAGAAPAEGGQTAPVAETPADAPAESAPESEGTVLGAPTEEQQ